MVETVPNKRRKNSNFVRKLQNTVREPGGGSVIQGNKNRGFLYTAFSIEVAFLPELMNNPTDFEVITRES